MTRDERLIRELCCEVALQGMHTNRFNELWMASGVRLEGEEFDILQKVMNRSKEETFYPESNTEPH